MYDNIIFVVWEDISSGTVKFRSGDFSGITSVPGEIPLDALTILPNPSSFNWTLSGEALLGGSTLELYDQTGRILYSKVVSADSPDHQVDINNSPLSCGIYFLRIVHSSAKGIWTLVKY